MGYARGGIGIETGHAGEVVHGYLLRLKGMTIFDMP
jgi:hypothetical protein